MKLPIVVVGTGPRCGSTPYVEMLSQQLDLPAFYEPWTYRILETNPVYRESYDDYVSMKNRTNRYIVKFWITDLEYRSPYLEDFKSGYKILLRRKDLIGQIASCYIAETLNKFHTLIEEQEIPYRINISSKEISILIRFLTRSFFITENITIFDKHIYYEDIDFSTLKSNYKKTIQPSNIDEIRQEIEKQLKDSIPIHWIKDKSNSQPVSISL